MQREVKFRGFSVHSNEWVFGYLLICGMTGKTYIFPYGNDVNESDKVGEEGCLKLVTFEVIPETVGQYTGLKDYSDCLNEDETDKEIYEGDVIVATTTDMNYTTVTGHVKYESGMFIVVTKEMSDGYIPLFDFVEGDYINGCVKGNTHDNPELLQEAEKKMINITCENCVHADYCINNGNIEPNHNNCGIDYGYAFNHEKFEYECGNCQREDAPCDYCIRNEQNTDKEDPDLEDLYYHD